MYLSNFRRKLFENRGLLIYLTLLLPLYFVVYKFYIPHANAFGCFDDCFNYVGGFFLLKGKHIYADFFFNHMPLPAYISALIQSVTHPQNMFDLVLKHRQFIILFSLAFNVLLVIRFRAPAVVFAFIFELSKFYIFGDRFLAEPMAVYPIIYLFGLAYIKTRGEKLNVFDYLLSPIFTWFVIFTREPYVPLALFLFLIVLWNKKDLRQKKWAILIFLALSGLILITMNLKEFFYNIVIVNNERVSSEVGSDNLLGTGLLQIFFNPLFIFLEGEWNLFRELLIGIDIAFSVLFINALYKKKYLLGLLIFTTLALANLRPVLPGFIFYGAFHMIIWFGIFVFATSLLLFSNLKNLKIFVPISLVLVISLMLVVTSKSYFGYEPKNQQADFLTNYGRTYQIGEVVRILSDKNDTLFLDGDDDLIYWQAKILSPYKYTWYTSTMPFYEKYSRARVDMLKNDLPDFYKEAGLCLKKNLKTESVPSSILRNYVRLLDGGNPSCLFVKKSKMGQISQSQWKKVSDDWYYTYDKTTKAN